MEAPYPSYTKTWHNKPYPAISPSRPELSAAGKTIVIAGGGQGIGRSIALAFGEAGASHIALLARRISDLNEAQELITRAWPAVKVTVHSVDITDEKGLARAADAIGQWDVLVLNAAVLQLGKALEGSLEEWWNVFEINVKGTVMTARAFFPTKRPDGKIIGITSSGFVFPAPLLVGTGSYNASKLAQAKVLEFMAAENPDTFVGIVNPGFIVTEMVQKNGFADRAPADAPELPANFVVWMASPEAAFTRRKLVYANFDVDELKAKADRLANSPDLTIGLHGQEPLDLPY